MKKRKMKRLYTLLEAAAEAETKARESIVKDAVLNDGGVGDLRTAVWYLNRVIERLEKDDSASRY